MLWCLVLWVLQVSQVGDATLLDNVDALLRESDQQLLVQLRPLPLEPEYDWVIVGAGTAGCTLASRLSEVPEWQVLLLEAGGEEEFATDIPILVGKLQKTKVDWQYKAEPSTEYCRGYAGTQCYIPRGKIFGGSSVLNYMLATRGNRADYDLWESLGNPGWGFNDVLPYFIKAENMTIPELRSSSFHGTKGPLSISQSTYKTKLVEAFLQAGRELGHMVGDYNGPVQNQFSRFQFTKKNGRRASNPRAYIYPVLRQRKNLHIRVNAFVTKLILKGDQVEGVTVDYNGGRHEVRVRKEVVLSAGAINSPQILMLSGIGPRTHLEAIGLPVFKDLPVGLNLQDHVSFSGLLFITNLNDSQLNPACIANDPRNLVNYVKRGFGPYEIPGGNEGVFFYDINRPNAKNGIPDIEIHFSTVSPTPEEIVRGFTPEIFNTVFKPYQLTTSWAIQPILMHPKSRGRVELRSKNPYDKMKIIPNYFQHPEDVQVVLKGIRKAFEISRTRAMQQYGARPNPSVVPGCGTYPRDSDAYWTCVMRTTTITNYHQCGTCAMTPQGVVDSRLRVHGVHRLRVIDASIMPTVPAAHTNIPTNMIAEKGADIIKEDYKQPY